MCNHRPGGSPHRIPTNHAVTAPVVLLLFVPPLGAELCAEFSNRCPALRFLSAISHLFSVFSEILLFLVYWVSPFFKWNYVCCLFACLAGVFYLYYSYEFAPEESRLQYVISSVHHLETGAFSLPVSPPPSQVTFLLQDPDPTPNTWPCNQELRKLPNLPRKRIPELFGLLGVH